MTAQPLSNALAKVRKLLPVRIAKYRRGTVDFIIRDKNGAVFCYVPMGRDDDKARAELIRDAMNGMA